MIPNKKKKRRKEEKKKKIEKREKMLNIERKILFAFNFLGSL